MIFAPSQRATPHPIAPVSTPLWIYPPQQKRQRTHPTQYQRPTSTQRAVPFTHQIPVNDGSRSMPAFAPGLPSLFHRILRLPSPHQLLVLFTHRLPPLLRWESSLPSPPAQPAHLTPDNKPQAPGQPPVLGQPSNEVKCHRSGDVHPEATPSNGHSVDKRDVTTSVPRPSASEPSSHPF